MHHALQIQEILTCIFEYCCPLDQVVYPTSDMRRTAKINPDLAMLARTCRTFKEPALDVLWRVLFNLSPLARCLPEASHQVFPDANEFATQYSFNRSLTQAELGILENYARRIRSIQYFNRGLDWESVRTFLNLPPANCLFPNLRALHCEYTGEVVPFVPLPLPSLVHLEVIFLSRHTLLNFLWSFPKFSANIRELRIEVFGSNDTPIKFEPNFMNSWNNIHCLSCGSIALDADALLHLSKVPALKQLTFVVGATLPASHSPLVFPKLRDLSLFSKYLDQISHLISRTRLPSLSSFHCSADKDPSEEELFDLFTSVSISNTSHTLEMLEVERLDFCRNAPPIRFETLVPLKVFRNLCVLCLKVDSVWPLTDDDMVALASEWPMMERLSVDWSLSTGDWWDFTGEALRMLSPETVV